jgi:hypothetical protein
MRSLFGKCLRDLFEKRIKQRFVGVKPIPLSLPPGSRAWLLGSTNTANAYLLLILSPRNERFTIELAWSEKKRLPERSDMMPGEPSAEGELRFRISRLWQPTGFEVWYDLEYDKDYPDSGPSSVYAPEEPCMARIPVKVDRAMNAIEEHGIPYFEKVVGISIKSGE